MTHDNHEYPESQNQNGHGRAVFTGVVLGGLTGAITALLLAPRSGAETRRQIRTTVIDVRERAGEKVDETVGQLRTKADQIKVGLGSKAKELKNLGTEALADQLDRVSAAAEAGKRSLQGIES